MYFYKLLWMLPLLWILPLLFPSSVTTISFQYESDSKNKFVFVFSDNFEVNNSTFEELNRYGWIKQYEITPKTYILLNKSDNDQEKSVSLVKRTFKDAIVRIDKVKEYVGVLPVDQPAVKSPEMFLTLYKSQNLVCDKYYGMGIEDAWSRGYTGKGVVVAVTDIGVNTDLIDLSSNINLSLSFNFISNTENVTPERYPNYQERKEPDHGNQCASIIAAVKGNEFCSAGIAFNATLAVFKIYTLKESRSQLSFKTCSDAMARYPRHGNIDIYSNSWGPGHPFMKINVDQEKALNFSSKEGRRGKGALHIFPVSAVGNELVNNENTIAVSAIGPNGTLPDDNVISSSTLTSGLLKGNNLTADFMVTTSYNDNCVTSFQGVSAATAQVAGMLALALEANPFMTFNDVQDLIVKSSDVNCLADSEDITTNAAGLKFHPVLGFGLLNASKLVTHARMMQTGAVFTAHKISKIESGYNSAQEYIVEFGYCCPRNTACPNTVKLVKIRMKYKTSASHMRIQLVSPSNTVSVLQDFRGREIETKKREQVLTSVHFWNEEAFGLWTLKLQSDAKTSMIDNVTLTVFGTMPVPGTARAQLPDLSLNSGEDNVTDWATICRSQNDATKQFTQPLNCVQIMVISLIVVLIFW